MPPTRCWRSSRPPRSRCSWTASGSTPVGDRVLDTLLTELARFTGLDWKQEDDITAVSLTRSRGDMHPAADGIAARGRSGSGGAGVGRQLVGRRS